MCSSKVGGGVANYIAFEHLKVLFLISLFVEGHNIQCKMFPLLAVTEHFCFDKKYVLCGVFNITSSM